MIVDTQVSPLCMLSVSCSLCLFEALLKYTYSYCKTFTYTIGEIKTGKARFHALSQFDLRSFDQNTLGISRIFSHWPSSKTAFKTILCFKKKLCRESSVKREYIDLRPHLWLFSPNFRSSTRFLFRGLWVSDVCLRE